MRKGPDSTKATADNERGTSAAGGNRLPALFNRYNRSPIQFNVSLVQQKLKRQSCPAPGQLAQERRGASRLAALKKWPSITQALKWMQGGERDRILANM